MEHTNETRKGNYITRTYYDQSPESPREWDNFGKMICFHNRYNLGDKHDYKSNDYNSWGELKYQIEKDYNVGVILPLYLYDHSGITISTSSFSCQWDSGQVGWIFISEKQLNKMCGNDFERGEENLSLIMNSEVRIYDEFLTGEVYQYKVYEIETCNKGHEQKTLVECCGSYYSEDDCWDEGKSVLQHLEGVVV